MSGIAVVRLLPGLGDMLCLVPALRSFRAGHPDAHIALVGLPSSAWMVGRYPNLIDQHLPVPYWPGIPEANVDRRTTVRSLRAARAARFDLAVQLHGTGWFVNDLTLELGARVASGHHPPGARPDEGRWRTWPEHGHEIHRLSGLVHWLGFPDAGDHLQFPALSADALDVARHVPGGLPARYVVVHPGASRADRRWRADGFVALIDSLHDRDCSVLVTAGDREVELVEYISERCQQRPVGVRGLSIGGLGAVLRQAQAVVSNDTGVAHLAVACDVPSVVIVTTSDPDRWGPLDRDRHCVVEVSKVGDVGDVASVLASLDALVSTAGSAAGRGAP